MPTRPGEGWRKKKRLCSFAGEYGFIDNGSLMGMIRITAGGMIPETVSLNAGEVLLVVIVFLVLVDTIFLLVMKYKYTVGLKNRKLREFIEKLLLKKGKLKNGRK